MLQPLDIVLCLKLTSADREFPGYEHLAFQLGIALSSAHRSVQLTRSQFAVVIGVSERTVEGWEQGRRKPSGPALTLLRVAAKNPESILDTMRPVVN